MKLKPGGIKWTKKNSRHWWQNAKSAGTGGRMPSQRNDSRLGVKQRASYYHRYVAWATVLNRDEQHGERQWIVVTIPKEEHPAGEIRLKCGKWTICDMGAARCYLEIQRFTPSCNSGKIKNSLIHPFLCQFVTFANSILLKVLVFSRKNKTKYQTIGLVES